MQIGRIGAEGNVTQLAQGDLIEANLYYFYRFLQH